MLAVLCAQKKTSGQQEAASDHAIVFWNMKDPYQPERVLPSEHALLTFDINPQSPDVIIAGCANGLILLWELSHTQVDSP